MPWPSWFDDAAETLGLNGNEIAVLHTVWRHANSQRMAWPSQQTIAIKSGVVRSTVQKCLRRLVDTGCLDEIGSAEPTTGRGHSTRYRIPTKMPRVGQVRFMPMPTRPAVRDTDSGGWLAVPDD